MLITFTKNIFFNHRIPYDSSSKEIESGSISTNEIYIITPPDKPRLKDSIFVFVFFAKNEIKLPIPVDNPAKSVIVKAIKNVLSIYNSFYCQLE